MSIGKRPLILIVEDDSAIREIVQLSLEGEGYKVVTAENGQEALDFLLQSNRPDLILLDLMMPVMDGWTFAESIGRISELADIPFIVISAYQDDILHPKMDSLKRAFGNLKKPFTFQQLLQMVEECLNELNEK